MVTRRPVRYYLSVSILRAIFGKKGWAGQSAGMPKIAIFEIRLMIFGCLIVLCGFGAWSWMGKLDRQSYISVPGATLNGEIGPRN